jgi:transposase
MRGEILGLERRRRWSAGEKLSIVMAVGVDGATVTQVAQRHEITRQQIYAWRHALKRKGMWPVEDDAVFLPLDLSPESEAEPPFGSDGIESSFVEIALAKGRQLRVSSDLDDATLARLIRVVESA